MLYFISTDVSKKYIKYNTSKFKHFLQWIFFCSELSPNFTLTQMGQDIPTPCNLRRKLWQTLHLQYTRQLLVTVNKTKKSHSVHVVKVNLSKHIQQFRVMECLSYLQHLHFLTFLNIITGGNLSIQVRKFRRPLCGIHITTSDILPAKKSHQYLTK